MQIKGQQACSEFGAEAGVALVLEVVRRDVVWVVMAKLPKRQLPQAPEEGS